jgi:hypothetical protein
MELKVYVAGKVSNDSVFGTHDWRDSFCSELSRLAELNIINVDPTKSDPGFDLDQSNPQLIYGRNAFMISSSDLVIVNLTNDISVGGSQEMLIAKHYSKPLIGIAAKEGKFVRSEKELIGKTYHNWTDPIVNYTCDVVVNDLPSAAEFIKSHVLSGSFNPKNLGIIDQAVEYYRKNYYDKDTYLH